MPSFNITPEFFTRVEYAIVIVLVVDRASQAVAEHAFSDWWKGINGVLFKECSRRGRIALGRRDTWVRRCAELEEFVLS